jgi:hypothetical protein
MALMTINGKCELEKVARDGWRDREVIAPACRRDREQ